MTFDMNRTWAQSLAMVRANWQYLSLIAGVFFLLPNLALVIAMPDMMGMLIGPGGDPELMAEQLGAQLGPLLFVVMLAALFSMLGYGAMVALLGPSRPTVGEALGAAMRAFPVLLGTLAVGVIGYSAVVIIGALAVGLIGAVLAVAVGQAVAATIGVIVLIAVLFALALRFILVVPVVMLEGERNPLAPFKRSWRLTKPVRRQLVLFFFLLMIAYLVISMLLFSVVGLAGSLFVTGLINGVAGAAVALVLAAILVSLWEQLSGHAQGTASTFE
ncbi:glycerophosphoryl diester phosphodiesterase membrane domain-containing protein [Altererythrobacter lauratis]|uniref:Glycerophosphoryl diester phosphodiesterase membrane domain-containing protein n=1 Tax=Alteraurantiacibacter lauratis TaxID=2054627 RepID=A0ABV7ECH2_9SPHN